MDDKNGGWERYQNLVIDKLDNHSKKFDEVENHLTKIQVEIATLKVKASLWGGVGGLIPIVIAIVLFFSTNN